MDGWEFKGSLSWERLFFKNKIELFLLYGEFVRIFFMLLFFVYDKFICIILEYFMFIFIYINGFFMWIMLFKGIENGLVFNVGCDMMVRVLEVILYFWGI